MRATRFPRLRSKWFAAVALCILGAAVRAAAPVLPASPQAWSAAAQADIEAAVQVTRANHPGAVDPHNPAFLPNLEAARRHGLALAARVVDAPGYVAAVQGFNVHIGDGHAGLYPRLDDAVLPPDRWPGFVTVWRGDALYVHSSQAGGPAVGSKLLGCDGKDADRLIRDNVFRFQGRVNEAGQWWLAARRVFHDEHNPFIALPQRCRFERAGRVTEHALAWRPLDAEGGRWLANSNWGEAKGVGVLEPRKNLYWVSMPTFHPNEAERAAYRTMFRDIEAQRARWLALDAVVIDLRKNQGGSSDWSQTFAGALWGKARVTQALAAHDAGVEVRWRASRDNTDYMTVLADRLASEGSADSAAWARVHAEGMRAALAQGRPFYVEKEEPAAPAADTPMGPAFTRPVYVVVPGNCVSACLDAIDVFTRFPNTVLIGAPSSADSTYMEVRAMELPSGLARVIVPNKVYVNRKRANGQVYPAAIEVRDVDWSGDTLLRTVETDLAKRK